MTTTVHRIQPGQPLPDRAEYWNQFVDAADYANSQRDKQGEEVSDVLPYATAVLFKKDFSPPGKVFERGQVMAIGTSLNDATVNLDLFLERPVFVARPTAFSTDFGRIAVTYQSIDDQEIGYGFPTGISIVRFHEKENEGACQFADVFEDGSPADFGVDNTFMQSHWSGSWQVLFRDVTLSAGDPSEGSSGFAIVQHIGPQQREMKATTDVSIARGASGLVTLELNLLPILAKVTAHFNWLSQETISAGKEIIIQWFNDELQWDIKQAECEVPP